MNICNLAPKEIKSISENLEQAKIDHIQWVNILNEHLICKGSLDLFIEKHTTCSFGRWYSSLEGDVLTCDEIKPVGDLHEKVHALANTILKNQREGRPITVNEYGAFIHVEEKFLDALNVLHSSVTSTKHGFDFLTNIPNRGLIELILEKEYAFFERNSGDYCIALADIDFFKNVNDTYGHFVGDKVLQAVAKQFSLFLRKYDSVGRYGGEEFLFCLPKTDLADAKNIIERVRLKIQNLPIHISKEESIQITCSFGLAKFIPGKSLSEIINFADEAMYFAKENGRNRVEVCDN
jgi:diguanylate cyclase (GGDEF)-like protein